MIIHFLGPYYSIFIIFWLIIYYSLYNKWPLITNNYTPSSPSFMSLKLTLYSPVENQNDLELDFKVFFFADSCCSDIVLDEFN